MSDDYRPEGFEDSHDPLPRDMQDQQAGAQEPPQREETADRQAGEAGDGGGEGESGATGEDVPDVDEAGAGRRGSQEAGGPGVSAPEESPG
jgi:hypothetical protein